MERSHTSAPWQPGLTRNSSYTEGLHQQKRLGWGKSLGWCLVTTLQHACVHARADARDKQYSEDEGNGERDKRVELHEDGKSSEEEEGR